MFIEKEYSGTLETDRTLIDWYLIYICYTTAPCRRYRRFRPHNFFPQATHVALGPTEEHTEVKI